MRSALFLVLLFAIVAWAIDIPPIQQNSGVSAAAQDLWAQVHWHNKIRFDTDTQWQKFVRSRGEDYLTDGINKIHRYAFIDERTKDTIRSNFQHFLRAPAGEHAVPDATNQFLLKNMINYYDLTKA